MPPLGTRRAILAGFTALGLAVLALGTFLPWFHSGRAQRNSYETAALIDHFDVFDNAIVRAILTAWVAVPLVSAVCIGLYAVRLPRTAALCTIVTALLTGTISVAAIVEGPDTSGIVGLTTAGPLTTTVGATVALVGGLSVLAAGSTARSETGRAGVPS